MAAEKNPIPRTHPQHHSKGLWVKPSLHASYAYIYCIHTSYIYIFYIYSVCMLAVVVAVLIAYDYDCARTL